MRKTDTLTIQNLLQKSPVIVFLSFFKIITLFIYNLFFTLLQNRYCFDHFWYNRVYIPAHNKNISKVCMQIRSNKYLVKLDLFSSNSVPKLTISNSSRSSKDESLHPKCQLLKQLLWLKLQL